MEDDFFGAAEDFLADRFAIDGAFVNFLPLRVVRAGNLAASLAVIVSSFLLLRALLRVLRALLRVLRALAVASGLDRLELLVTRDDFVDAAFFFPLVSCCSFSSSSDSDVGAFLLRPPLLFDFVFFNCCFFLETCATAAAG